MPNDIFEAIKDFNTITIFRHVFADMDAIGSQFGLKYYLKNKYPNKAVYCIGSDCPVSQRNNVYMDVVDDQVIKSSLAIVLDTSNAARIDDDRYKLAKKSIRIDHHVRVETICDEEWIDDKASATCELIALYLKDQNASIPVEAALMLYLGLTADNIRFTTNNVRPATFDAAKYLFEQGVDVTKVEQLNFSKSMSDYKYETVVRNHTTLRNKFLYSILECEDYENLGLSFTDAKDKVYCMAGIENVEMWALFTRMEDRIHYSASLRSRNIPIRDVAVNFGGGGHECASGIKNLTRDQVHQIIEILSNREVA